VLDGEKWFVTFGSVAAVIVVMAMAEYPDRPGERLPTLFAVPSDAAGVEIVDDPPFTHNYPHGHPTIRFDCELPADAVLGGPDLVGKGGRVRTVPVPAWVKVAVGEWPDAAVIDTGRVWRPINRRS
jgi:alkylation response protein AidB-like acyl-CoA dehydrogenase